jgi:acetolactate synthase-1/2/3 large subunit
MATLTGGQAVVETLKQQGIDTIFAVPGIQLDHLFNALYEERNSVRVIHTRHEQGAAYMAFGYAASTGRVGTFVVVPGPGLLNTTAALSTGYACNTPMLCISGQIPSAAIGRGFGLLHEIPDQLALIRGLTKYAERADTPEQVPEVMRGAFGALFEGRVRPVEIEVPMDILATRADVDLGPVVVRAAPSAPDPKAIERAAKLLGEAQRPLIMVGGGVTGAEAPLLALAEMLQAPVVMSKSALGAVSDRHYLAQKYPAGNRLWADADVVLGVGTRMNPVLPAWGMDDDLTLIRMDIDPVEIDRALSPDLAIVADATAGLEALVKSTEQFNIARESREGELVALKQSIEKELYENLAPQMAYIKVLREGLPEEGILVEELTQVAYVSRFAFPVYRPRSFIGTGYQGTLGFGFATALGVKVGNPERPVLSITGDGGFMYNVQELATAVQQGIDIVTVVFNDGAFGNVQRMQIEDYGGKVIATNLHNPDFVALAQSFGAQGLRANSPEELAAALKEGFATPGPTLIDVPIGETPAPWGYLNLPKVRG